MSSLVSMGGLQAALTFPFKDRKWGTKFLIAGLLALANFIIPIIPSIILLGYSARIMRRIANDDGQPALPEWDNWGDLFIDGLRLFGLNLIYLLPGIVLIGIGYLTMVIPMFGGMMESQRMTWQPLGWMMVMWLFLGIGILYIIVVSFLLGPAQVHMIARQRFGAGFEFGAWWKVLKANVGGFLLAYIIVIGIGQLLSGLVALTWFTICLICLLPLIAIAVGIYIQVVTAALYALAYREGIDKFALPAEV